MSYKPADSIRQPLPELTALRKPRSKVYDLGDGKRRLVQKLGKAIHYQVGGALSEIDLEPVEQERSFSLITAPFELTVEKGLPKHILTFKGKTVISELIELDGIPLSDLTINLVPVVVADGLLYRDFVPGLDIKLQIRDKSVEWYKILKTPLAPKSFTWKVTEDQDFVGIVNTRSKGYDAQGLFLDMTVDVSAPAITQNTKVYQAVETFGNRVSEKIDRPSRQRRWRDVGDVTYPVTIDATETITITDANTVDDVYQNHSPGDLSGASGSGNGYCGYGASNALYVGNYSDSDAFNYHLGLRFRSVDIAGDATIDSATILVEVLSLTGTPDVVCYGDDVDDAALWADGSLPSAITKTAASTAANPGGTGDFQITVTAIVAEIIARGSWGSGNDMRFAYLNESAVSAEHWYTVADTNNNGGGIDDPVLTIDYTPAGPPGARPQGPLGHPLHGPFAGPVN